MIGWTAQQVNRHLDFAYLDEYSYAAGKPGRIRPVIVRSADGLPVSINVTVNSELPPGFKLDSGTGVVSFDETTTRGTHVFELTAAASNGLQATTAFTLNLG